MSTEHKTNHLRRPRPAASRPPRAHKLAHLPGCPYLQDPVLPSSDAERLNSLVEFFGLQGYEAMQIVELARVALDLCEAGGPDPIARQVMADLLCQAPYWDHLVSVSKDRRIYCRAAKWNPNTTRALVVLVSGRLSLTSPTI